MADLCPTDRVRFYTAELVLALETLHTHKVIFRLVDLCLAILRTGIAD